MEEINLKEMFSYFLSKIVIIIVATLVAIFCGCLYSLYIQKPMYNSSTTVVLARSNEETNNDNGITNNDITLNQKLVSTYREIIKSRRVLNQVIENLKLDTTFGELQSQINVSNEKDTEILRITVINRDANNAKIIADEIARVFGNEIVEIYSIKNVSIIDYAVVNKKPYNVNILKQIILAALIGGVLACIVVFMMFYFDTTVKTPEEVEQKLGLPVLGAVPNKPHKGGKK